MGANQTGEMNIDMNSAYEPLREIVNFAMIIGFGFACIKMLLLIPTLTGDSPEARSRAKKSFALFLIVAIALAAAYPLWSIFINALGEATGEDMSGVVDTMDTTGEETTLPDELSHILAIAIAVLQVGVTGIFVIKLTWEGISYFSTYAVGEKALLKTRIGWTCFWGALAFGATSIMRLIYNIFSNTGQQG